MRLFCLLAMCSLLWTGCASDKSGGMADQPVARIGPQPATAVSNIVVTPSGVVTGTVALVNPNARYAVLSFPIGSVPPVDQQLNVYRDGLKVGEVRITGPQRDNNTVGDIIAGEAQKGDEVREN